MKKTTLIVTCLLVFGVAFVASAQKDSSKDYLVTLKTKFGTQHLVLFDETPLHKANFINLIRDKFYDGLLFHRVIPDFVIQGGDPNSRYAAPDELLGNGGADREKIPFEFTPEHVHTKGALAAAHDGNPEKKSSATQFYIVTGKVFTDDQLTAMQSKNGMDYTPAQRSLYTSVGGLPHLDNNYTVFGTAIDNFELIDIIAAQPRNAQNRPKTDIKMELSVKKMRKKAITKKYGYVYE